MKDFKEVKAEKEKQFNCSAILFPPAKEESCYLVYSNDAVSNLTMDEFKACLGHGFKRSAGSGEIISEMQIDGMLEKMHLNYEIDRFVVKISMSPSKAIGLMRSLNPYLNIEQDVLSIRRDKYSVNEKKWSLVEKFELEKAVCGPC
ncbi:hypothetical protein ACFORL_10865 [Legionella dresdenensis]|uniref:Uncharacterized protein n=1 Tax=Legionella dresdenensis TaxID=450200 RepID=A0ABV8CH43_9GAMM